MNFIKRWLTWWNSQTVGTQFFTWRFGEKVGEDAQGNLFYRNADNSRRWVVYNGEALADRVTPDWHGWLHFTWDEPPTDAPLLHRTWEKPHLANMTGTDAAYVPPGSITRMEPERRRDYEAWSPD